MLAAVTLVVATVGILAPHVSRLDVFVIQSAPDLAALFAIGVVSAPPPAQTKLEVIPGMGVVFDAGTPEQAEQGGPIFVGITAACTPPSSSHRWRCRSSVW